LTVTPVPALTAPALDGATKAAEQQINDDATTKRIRMKAPSGASVMVVRGHPGLSANRA
jgi:hypothetical protein